MVDWKAACLVDESVVQLDVLMVEMLDECLASKTAAKLEMYSVASTAA
jgi:hypothetical protein